MIRKSPMPALALLAAFAFMPFVPAHAAADDNSPASAASESSKAEDIFRSLHFNTGTVAIPAAKATLQLKPGYSFLSAADAQRVLTDLWHNPPDHDVLGLILPGTDPQVLQDDDSWAVVVTYTDDGYVSDEDAAKTDYAALLKDMQKDTEEANPERIKQGYPALELVGWAEPPHYDAAAHKLYWARDLQVKKTGAEGGDHSLNYDIRVLGRKGYLSLSAIAPIEQLAKVRADMPQVLAMTDFDAGERYADYDNKTDKLAAYGISALVAGGIAAKAGLFAKLGMLLLGLKKFIVLGIAAIVAALRKLFNRKKSD